MLNSLKSIIGGDESDAEVEEEMKRGIMTPQQREYYEKFVKPAEVEVRTMDYDDLMGLSRKSHPFKYVVSSIFFHPLSVKMVKADEELERRRQVRDARRLALGE